MPENWKTHGRRRLTRICRVCAVRRLRRSPTDPSIAKGMASAHEHRGWRILNSTARRRLAVVHPPVIGLSGPDRDAVLTAVMRFVDALAE
jgi:hypothetical protein